MEFHLGQNERDETLFRDEKNKKRKKDLKTLPPGMEVYNGHDFF